MPVTISNEDLKKLQSILIYRGWVVTPGQPSVAIINDMKLWQGKPELIDLNRPNFKPLKVVAEEINEKRVVLRLLDGTNRTIELVPRPSGGP